MSAEGGQVVLAGDIGGTHTRLALYAVPWSAATRPPLGLTPCAQVSLASGDMAARGTLEGALATFLGDAGRGVPAAAVLACAGPVHAGESRVTNLPWVISERQVQAATGVAQVRVVNDFEAMAHGTSTLRADEREVLQAGKEEAQGARLVLGAGTGLGQAWVVPPGRVFASEGGHQSFAPRDELEDGLLAWLRTRYGRVSTERVVSGLGLVDLYTYLADVGAASTTEAMRQAVVREGARAIGTEGLRNDGDPTCQLAVRRFVSLYGACAGDAALSLLPHGGVVIAGGVAVALLPAMREHFMPSFLDKGRLRSALEPLHVSVALAEDTGLRGAAQLAFELARR